MGGHRISPVRVLERPVRPSGVLVSARSVGASECEEAPVKSAEEMMEILEAFDLVGSLRGAAALVGCDHKTVARCVALREAAAGELRRRWARRSARGGRAAGGGRGRGCPSRGCGCSGTTPRGR